MKRLLTISKKVAVFVCIAIAALVMAGCKDKNKKPTTVIENVQITLEVSADQIKFGEEVKLTVTVTGSKNTGHTVKVTESGKEVDYAVVENDVLKLTKDVTIDKFITVTVTADADKTKTAVKTLTVKAPVIEGQVGDLTSELIKEIANPNITFTGIVTDTYTDLNNKRNNSIKEYESTVKMNDGKWYGTWNPKDDPTVVTTDTYLKGEKDGVTDQYGNVGHTMEYEYVNKNNEVTKSYVKDYKSIPAVWEAQHLWNHLGQLNVNKFTYDAKNEVYKYNRSTEEDDYLLTYFAVSLTPMLGTSETLVDFYLKIENGHITEILGQTVVLYDGSVDVKPQDASTVAYTTVSLKISDLGTTTIGGVKAYDAPQNADKLTAALAKMSTLRNYTFEALETQTYAPSTDDSDYELNSVSSNVNSKRALSIYNYTSSTGKVGVYGQVTENAVLYETTSKYDYTMDGKDYVVEFSGLKQVSDGNYDEFEFNASKSVELNETVFEGTKRYYGNMFDKLPSFDMSANIFEFVTSFQGKSGETYYRFELREQLITRDVAIAVSAHPYAVDGERDNQHKTTITVDSNGYVVQTVYPYNLASGTYLGYITTTYDKFNETTLEEGIFDNYIERQIKTTWDQYDVMYYHPTYTTDYTEEAKADVVFKKYLGASQYNNLPSPTLFLEIFGDNVSGPFFDYQNRGTSEAPDYHEWLGITVKTERCDENYQVPEEIFQEIKAELDAKLGAIGYKLDQANTDISGGETGYGDYYLCYYKGDVQIVIETNHTRFFWIDFYKLGDWTLTK